MPPCIHTHASQWWQHLQPTTALLCFVLQRNYSREPAPFVPHSLSPYPSIATHGPNSDLTEPIDVYTDWIDECEAVNAVDTAAEEHKEDEQFIDAQEIAEG